MAGAGCGHGHAPASSLCAVHGERPSASSPCARKGQRRNVQRLRWWRFFPVRTEGAQGAPFFPERGAPPAAAARPVWKRPAGLCPEQETVPLPGAGNDPCGLRMGRPCQTRVFCVQNIPSRSVAQHGSAPALGAGGRWFESSRSDHMRSRGHTTMWCDLFCFCGPLVTAPAAGAVTALGTRASFPPGSLCGRAWTGRREPRLQEAPSLASMDRQD